MGATGLRVFTIKDFCWEDQWRGAAKLVPVRVSRKGNTGQRIRDEILRKAFDQGDSQRNVWKPNSL